MQATAIRRTLLRMTGIVAILTSLLLSAGSALAVNHQSGLTECEYDGCRVVTVNDLAGATRGAAAAPVRSRSFPAGPFDPHFTQ